MVSYDVNASFTSVPVDSAISLVQGKLLHDPLLPHSTSMSISQIITFLEFFLKNTYFLFQGRYFEQVNGAAMDSPYSPLIANLFMEFWRQDCHSAPNSPAMAHVCGWPFVIQKAEHSSQFIQHINSLDPPIHFTTVNPKEDSSIPFLDTLVSLGPNNTLTTSAYRKPTDTDQNPHWDKSHNLPVRHSVYNTLAHRAKVVCASQAALK